MYLLYIVQTCWGVLSWLKVEVWSASTLTWNSNYGNYILERLKKLLVHIALLHDTVNVLADISQ